MAQQGISEYFGRLLSLLIYQDPDKDQQEPLNFGIQEWLQTDWKDS